MIDVVCVVCAHVQSKADKFKCLRTSELLELIQSWSNPKFQINSNLSLSNYGTELIQRAWTFMPDKFKFAPFSAMESNLFEEQELKCMLDKFRFAPLSTMELNISEEGELSCRLSSNSLLFTHRTELIHTHTSTLAGVGCLIPSVIKVWMTLDEINSVMGKELVTFKEIKEENQAGKNWTYPAWRACRTKACIWTYLTWTYPLFL